MYSSIVPFIPGFLFNIVVAFHVVLCDCGFLHSCDLTVPHFVNIIQFICYVMNSTPINIWVHIFWLNKCVYISLCTQEMELLGQGLWNIFNFNRYSQIIVFHTVVPVTLPSAMHENFRGSQPARIQYVYVTPVVSHMDLHFPDHKSVVHLSVLSYMSILSPIFLLAWLSVFVFD